MAGLFLQWLLVDAPRTYLASTRSVTLALFNYFSIPLLASTLFDPWRHDAIDLAHVPVRDMFQAIIANTTSRVIGFVVRLTTIVMGLFSITVFQLGVLLFFISWYGLPILLVGSIMYGFRLIAGGI